MNRRILQKRQRPRDHRDPKIDYVVKTESAGRYEGSRVYDAQNVWAINNAWTENSFVAMEVSRKRI